MSRLDLQNLKWENKVSLPILPSSIYTFSLNGYLFCVAYESARTAERNVKVTGIYAYDILENQWKNACGMFSLPVLQCMYTTLEECGSVAECKKTNKIFTVTRDKVCCMQASTKDGDFMCNSISDCPLVPQYQENNHSQHVCIVVNSHLYVLGGEKKDSQTEIFPSADVYKLNINNVNAAWIKCCPMSERRSMFDVASIGNDIYAVGGFNTVRLRSVECYNTVNDYWTVVKAMDSQRSHLRAITYNDKLYVLGGKSYANRNGPGGGARKVLKTCEIYDPGTDTWDFLPPMDTARCLFGACVY